MPIDCCFRYFFIQILLFLTWFGHRYFTLAQECASSNVRGFVLDRTDCLAAYDVWQDSNSNLVFAACQTGDVMMYNLTTSTKLAVIKSQDCNGPSNLWFDPASSVLFVACAFSPAKTIAVYISGGLTSAVPSSSPYFWTLTSGSTCYYPLMIVYNPFASEVAIACYAGGLGAVVAVPLQNLNMAWAGALVIGTPRSVLSYSDCINTNAVAFKPSSSNYYAACDQGIIMTGANKTFTLLVDKTVCPIPYGVAYDTVSSLVYAACFNGGVVSISGRSNYSMFASSDACPDPFAAWHDSSMMTFISCASSVIVVKNLTSLTVDMGGECPGQPTSVSYDQRLQVMFVSCSGGGIIQVGIRGETVTPVTVTQYGTSRGLTYSPSTGALIVASYGGDVFSILGPNVNPLTTSAICSGPEDVLLIKDGPVGVSGGAVILAACFHSGIVLINGSSTTILLNSSICSNPRSVAYNPNTNSVYAACFYSGIIQVQSMSVDANGVPLFFQPGSQTVVSTLLSPDFCLLANGVAVNRNTSVVYATCLGNGVSDSNDSAFRVNGSSIVGLANYNCFSAYYIDVDPLTSTVAIGCDGSQSVLILPELPSNPNDQGVTLYADLPASFQNQVSSLVCLNARRMHFLHGSTGGRVLLVPCYGGSTYEIDMSPANKYAKTEVATYFQCSGALDISYDPSRNVYYAACKNSGVVALGYKSCPLGYEFQSAALSCTACSTGYFSNISLPSTQPCSICAPGSYSNQLASITCTLCQPGFYAASQGLSVCTACAIGRYTENRGTSVCSQCEPGKYQDHTGSTACIPCSVGTFSSLPGLTVCSLCPNGTVSESPQGSSTCTICHNGTYSQQSESTPSAQCLLCAPDQYNFDNASSKCHSCSAAGVFCQQGTIWVSSGFWGYKDDQDRLATVACPSTNCNAGYLGQQCAEGRLQSDTNSLCGLCESGFAEWDGQCVDCRSGPQYGLILLFLLLFLLIVLAIHLVEQTANDNGALGIVLYFLQTSVLMAGSISGWLSWVGFLNFSPQTSTSSAAVCPFYVSPINKIYLGILISVISFGFLLVIALTDRALDGFIPTTFGQIVNAFSCDLLSRKKPFSINAYIRTCVALLLYSYAQVCQTVFLYLSCVDGGLNNSVIFTSPSINCNSDEYKQFLPIMIVLLVVDIIGLPVFIVCFLRWNEKHFKSKNNSTSALEKSRFEYRFGSLWEPYSRRTNWWHVVVLSRRVVCVILDSFIVKAESIKFKMLGFVLLHLFALLLDNYVMPFASNFDNFLELTSMVLLIVIGAILTSNPPPYLPAIQVVVAVLIICPVCIFILLLVVRMFTVRYYPNSRFANVLPDLNSKSTRDLGMTSPRKTPSSIHKAGTLPFSNKNNNSAHSIFKPPAAIMESKDNLEINTNLKNDMQTNNATNHSPYPVKPNKGDHLQVEEGVNLSVRGSLVESDLKYGLCTPSGAQKYIIPNNSSGAMDPTSALFLFPRHLDASPGPTSKRLSLDQVELAERSRNHINQLNNIKSLKNMRRADSLSISKQSPYEDHQNIIILRHINNDNTNTSTPNEEPINKADMVENDKGDIDDNRNVAISGMNVEVELDRMKSSRTLSDGTADDCISQSVVDCNDDEGQLDF